MAKDVLNERQRKFVEYYTGNATQAARDAGYTGSVESLNVTGCRLLSDVKVAAALQKRNAKLEKAVVAELVPVIATRQEVAVKLTEMISNVTLEPRDRLSAMKLLAGMEGWLIARVQVEDMRAVSDALKIARKRVGAEGEDDDKS